MRQVKCYEIDLNTGDHLCGTEWRTKCHTVDCARNTFLLL